MYTTSFYICKRTIKIDGCRYLKKFLTQHSLEDLVKHLLEVPSPEKTQSSLPFSGSTEIEHWREMS